MLGVKYPLVSFHSYPAMPGKDCDHEDQALSGGMPEDDGSQG
jgi:hypothetical protein